MTAKSCIVKIDAVDAGRIVDDRFDRMKFLPKDCLVLMKMMDNELWLASAERAA